MFNRQNHYGNNLLIKTLTVIKPLRTHFLTSFILSTDVPLCISACRLTHFHPPLRIMNIYLIPAGALFAHSTRSIKSDKTHQRLLSQTTLSDCLYLRLFRRIVKTNSFELVFFNAASTITARPKGQHLISCRAQLNTYRHVQLISATNIRPKHKVSLYTVCRLLQIAPLKILLLDWVSHWAGRKVTTSFTLSYFKLISQQAVKLVFKRHDHTSLHWKAKRHPK